MELAQYIRLFRRWLWLLIVAAFVGGGVSFIVRSNQPPVYSARVTVIVGSVLESPNPNTTEIRTGIDLAVTYAQIVRTYDILDGVVDFLELPFSADRLRNMISTSIVSGTSLLEISVTNTDRILAAEIANEIATQLILQSPSNLTLEQQSNIRLLQNELDAQTEELAQLRTDLSETNQLLADDTLSDDEFEELRSTRTTLTNQINDASANIAQNLNTISSLTQRTNSVEIIETARIPDNPIGTSIVSTIILGALVSASLAFGGVLVYEYLNDTIRNADELSRSLNLPVLGVISTFGKKDMSYNDRLLTNLQNFSQTTEEYRKLRTNILYSASEDDRTFIFSSASPQEGKSVTAANIAISMALSGLRVLLIDADLRRPKVHEAFGLNNQIGLTNLLSGQISTDGILSDGDTIPLGQRENKTRVMDKDSWMQFTQKTFIPNLLIIPSGFTPSNPSELLGSVLMKRWMKQFRDSPYIDVVIFDTPPTLAVSDSTILAASLDAKVVLVIQASQTRRGVAARAKEDFENVNAEIVGTVLNNADGRLDEYYGYNYAYYYTPENQNNN